MLADGVRFTETVYKHRESDVMCRILEYIIIDTGNSEIEGVLVFSTRGHKVAMPRSKFDKEFYEFDAGESPASSIEI